MRGTYYDANGLSYLFDMNDPLQTEEREQQIQRAYFNEFFPLCLDSMFFGNEACFSGSDDLDLERRDNPFRLY